MERPYHGILRKAEETFAKWAVGMREGDHYPRYSQELDEIQLPSRRRFVCQEAFLAAWARGLILATGHPTRLARVDWTHTDETVKPREEFLCELAWTLLADRLGLGREYGMFVLTKADWTSLLTRSPSRFFEVLADACKAVDLLAPDQEG